MTPTFWRLSTLLLMATGLGLGSEIRADPVESPIEGTTAPSVVGLDVLKSRQDGTQAYAIGDPVTVVMTFDRPVVVSVKTDLKSRESREATPPAIVLGLGDATRNAVYVEGSGTERLIFRYWIEEGDLAGDGVAIAPNSLVSNDYAFVGAGSEKARLVHGALVSGSVHRVDGVRPAPTATDAAVLAGSTLLLNFDESLDPASVPAPEAFAVSGAGGPRSATEVAVRRRAILLTLDRPIESGAADVVVHYAVPDEKPIRDLAGNEATQLQGLAVPRVLDAEAEILAFRLERPPAERRIETILEAKAQRTPAQRKISSRLLDAIRRLEETDRGPEQPEAVLITVDIGAEVE